MTTPIEINSMIGQNNLQPRQKRRITIRGSQSRKQDYHRQQAVNDEVMGAPQQQHRNAKRIRIEADPFPGIFPPQSSSRVKTAPQTPSSISPQLNTQDSRSNESSIESSHISVQTFAPHRIASDHAIVYQPTAVVTMHHAESIEDVEMETALQPVSFSSFSARRNSPVDAYPIQTHFPVQNFSEKLQRDTGYVNEDVKFELQNTKRDLIQIASGDISQVSKEEIDQEIVQWSAQVQSVKEKLSQFEEDATKLLEKEKNLTQELTELIADTVLTIDPSHSLIIREGLSRLDILN